MDVLLACMAGDHACAWCLRRPAEGVGVLGPLGLELRATGVWWGRSSGRAVPGFPAPLICGFRHQPGHPPKEQLP